MRNLAVLVTLLTLVAPATGAPHRQGLPIVNDDYAGARARAQQREVPMFVEAWAPW